MTKFFLLIATSLLCLLAANAGAQNRRAAADSPDQKELFNYVLTMDKVHKIGNATKALDSFSKKHPEITDDSDTKTLDQTVQKIQKYPEAVAVLTRNGLTPREYITGLMTLMQASMAVSMKKAGTFKEYPADILKLVSKSNLDFVDQHWDEIQNIAKLQSDQ